MPNNRISPIGFESVSATTATPSIEIGTRCEDSSGNRYIYVYNAGQEIWPGRSAYLKTASTSYTITNTNAAAQIGQFAGAVHHATIPTAYYGWIMTEGLAAVSPDTNAVSFNAGNVLTVGVDEGYVVRAMTVTSGAADGNLFSAYGPAIGTCIGSGITSDGTVGVATMACARIRSHVW